MTSTVTAVSQSQSLAAIRNFVRASISAITHARGLCADGAFEPRTFLGMQVMHMVPSSTESFTISEWIEKGAFDALNRNYLKEMALCVHNGDCSELLESYCFGFTYTTDGQRATVTLDSSQQGSPAASTHPRIRRRRCSKEEVQQALSGILTRLLQVVDELPPLLSDRVLTMRLAYYEDRTPAAYQPPCFAPASERMVRFYKEEQRQGFTIGSMDTSHHLFSVAVRHPLLTQARQQAMEKDPCEEGMPRQLRRSPQETFPQTFPTTLTTSQSSWTEPLVDTLEVSSATAAEPSQHTVASRRCTNPKARAFVADLTADAPHRAEEARIGRPYHTVLLPVDLTNFSSLYHVVSKPPPLRNSEVAYLLLVAFSFARCAPTVGSRGGRLSLAELRDYLCDACALDISDEAAVAVMGKLTADGYLRDNTAHTHEEGVTSDPGAAGSVKVPRMSRGAGSAGELAGRSTAGDADLAGAGVPQATEWVMEHDPPLVVLTELLRQRQVVDLLAPADHAALHKLQTTLQKRRIVSAKQGTLSQPALRPERGGENPRLSCAESRKRRKGE